FGRRLLLCDADGVDAPRGKDRMIQKIAGRIWWVPARVWLLFAVLWASAIPAEYRTVARREPPEFFQLRDDALRQELQQGFFLVRDDALWQLVASSVSAGIALGLAAACWSGGRVRPEPTQVAPDVT